jgi:hypothetical protein
VFVIFLIVPLLVLAVIFAGWVGLILAAIAASLIAAVYLDGGNQ